MKAQQWIFGTLASADKRGYHCIEKSENLSAKICNGLEKYCLSYGENNLKADILAFSIQFVENKIVIIQHLSSNAIDHAGRQGGLIHHALIFVQNYGIDFSQFLIKDNFKTFEIIEKSICPSINLNNLKTLESYNKIDLSCWYNLLKTMATKNKKSLSIIKQSQFNHCWSVSTTETESLLFCRIVYNAFRIHKKNISCCNNVINPGIKTNLRLFTQHQVIENFTTIIIKNNPGIKTNWRGDYRKVYKMFMGKKSLFNKIKEIFK